MCSEILWHANFATSLLAVLSALYNIWLTIYCTRLN
jgi:hypothetical protein